MKTDPLKPSCGLLVKLGSIAVHVDEMISGKGHVFDKVAIKSLLQPQYLEGGRRDEIQKETSCD